MSGADGTPAGPLLVLATRNQGKLRELRELLRGKVPGLDVDTQVIDAETAGAPDVVEDGVTFEENALLKARAVAAATGLLAVADDSGLAVEVLGGAPGIFSARWAGRHGDDEANLRLLLDQLADVADEHRGALRLRRRDGVAGRRGNRPDGVPHRGAVDAAAWVRRLRLRPDPQAARARRTWPNSPRRRRTRSATAGWPSGSCCRSWSACSVPAPRRPVRSSRPGGADGGG